MKFRIIPPKTHPLFRPPFELPHRTSGLLLDKFFASNPITWICIARHIQFVLEICGTAGIMVLSLTQVGDTEA